MAEMVDRLRANNKLWALQLDDGQSYYLDYNTEGAERVVNLLNELHPQSMVMCTLCIRDDDDLIHTGVTTKNPRLLRQFILNGIQKHGQDYNKHLVTRVLDKSHIEDYMA